NVIKITAIPNPPRLLGYSSIAYLGLQVELGNINEICKELASHPEVHLIMTLMGGFSILCVIVLPNLEDLYKFIIEQVSQINGVYNVETSIRAELRKRTYLAFNIEEEITLFNK
ncbi:MAG: Lrp/AsnC ligand binding domain-containing protein, partial [Dehalococcoidia bacterium]